MLEFVRKGKTITDKAGTNRIYNIYKCPICDKEVERRSDNARRDDTCGNSECIRLFRVANKGELSRVNSKAVLQLTQNNKIVDTHVSIAQAARDTKVDRTGIKEVAQGKRKKAGGFLWKFL